VRYVARRRYGGRRRGRKSTKIPIISIAILAGQAAYVNAQGGTTLQKVGRFAVMYTGYNFATNAWDLPMLAAGYGPWVVKRFATKFARPGSSLGRMLPVSLS